LDLLSLKELLGMRFVSKRWNQFILNCKSLSKKLSGIEISFKVPETVANFNKEVKFLPFCRFYFKCLRYQIPDLEKFLNRTGKFVTCLKLDSISKYITDLELHFLDSLPSI